MLKIGYDAKRAFHNWSGLGNYSRDLLTSLANYHPENNYFLYDADPVQNERTRALFDMKSITIRSSKSKFQAYWRQRGLKSMVMKDNIDVFHGLSHDLPLLGPAGPASVITMHDLIYKRYPSHFGQVQSKIYDIKYKGSCKRADHVVAISESTKEDLIEFYGVPKSKLSVIYQSCHSIFREGKPAKRTPKMEALPGEFLLYVGSLIPRKNLLNLVKAIERFDDGELPVLIVVGKGKIYEKKLRSYLRRKKLEDRVRFFGDANLDELYYLYKHALLFIYPSLWEGFGIPIIEALFCKTPVITSNVSSMPEAAGPGAFYIDPEDPEDIAKGIKKVLGDSDRRVKLIEDGYEYVQRFDPRLISDEWNSLYKKLAK